MARPADAVHRDERHGLQHAGRTCDHFGFCAPAFSSDVVFDRANLALVGFPEDRQPGRSACGFFRTQRQPKASIRRCRVVIAACRSDQRPDDAMEHPDEGGRPSGKGDKDEIPWNEQEKRQIERRGHTKRADRVHAEWKDRAPI
jgi:hypothetical protein